MDEDLIKLVNKLQDTFSNLGARPPLISHPSRCCPSFAQLELDHVMGGICRWGAGHAPIGCGTQALHRRHPLYAQRTTPPLYLGWQPIRREIQCTRKVSEPPSSLSLSPRSRHLKKYENKIPTASNQTATPASSGAISCRAAKAS
jgi:ribosomal protein S30